MMRMGVLLLSALLLSACALPHIGSSSQKYGSAVSAGSAAARLFGDRKMAFGVQMQAPEKLQDVSPSRVAPGLQVSGRF